MTGVSHAALRTLVRLCCLRQVEHWLPELAELSAGFFISRISAIKNRLDAAHAYLLRRAGLIA
jgi:hypothetical protein